ncbi:MAG: PspC domain-containing protein [Actinomycetia bacterium]|nr:PspC domain-containing protein [Actinomycetes bacterium]MCP4962922.1 PspC domain-containing protein [Actinomycetes bacterium]
MIDHDMDMTNPGTGNRRLQRSNDERIAGVCGGIAEYFNLDPTIVRIAFVVLALIGFGAGIVAYGVMWLVMPDADNNTALDSVTEVVRNGTDKGKIAAIVIVGLLLVVISDGWVELRGGLLLPLVLVGGGIALIVGRNREPKGATSNHEGVAEPGDDKSGTVPVHPPSSSPPIDTDVVAVTPAPVDNYSGTVPPPPTFASVPGRPQKPRTPRTPSVITPVVLSLMILAGGVILVLDRAGAFDASLVMVGATWLLLIGAGLLVSTVRGRATGLIFIGLTVVVLTIAARWVDPILDDGTGEVRYSITTVEELETEYRLGAGELRVDLSDIDMVGQSRSVEVHLGIGELKVFVPAGIDIELDVDNEIGNVDYTDRTDRGSDINRAGLDNSIDLTLVGNDPSSTGSLDLNISSGIGNLEVIRVP